VLEAAGELVRVTQPVSTVLEMTEIQTRLLQQRRPGGAVRKAGHARRLDQPDPPALANLFGTVKRVAMGVTHREEAVRTTAAELREVGELLAFLKQPDPAARLSATPWSSCRSPRPSCRCGRRS
jgi:4-hydroxy-3-polyprenylbenzoate decarboxylase